MFSTGAVGDGGVPAEALTRPVIEKIWAVEISPMILTSVKRLKGIVVVFIIVSR